MRTAGLKLQCDKCEFLKKEVTYLGHVISSNGVSPNPKKLQAVREFPVPKNVKNVQQFLGLCNYYRRFIKNFADISKPLTILLKKHKEFEGKKEKPVLEWGESQNKAFEQLKELLTTAPVLIYPDFSKTFNVTTDASGYGLGAVLSQGEIGKDQPVAFASRTLNETERNWDTTDKEAAAIVFAVEQFRPYIYGTRFNLITDHRAFCWIKTKKDPNARVTRWRLRLSEYTYDIIFRPGREISHADSLSRNPVETEVKMANILSKREYRPAETEERDFYGATRKNHSESGSNLKKEKRWTQIKYRVNRPEVADAKVTRGKRVKKATTPFDDPFEEWKLTS